MILNKAKKNFNFSGIVALVLALLIVAVVVPINLIVSYFDVNIDTTPSKQYTLTDSSIKLLDSVKDKQIELYFLVSKDAATCIEDFSKDDETLPLYHALKQYDEYDNISINFLDPEADPDGAGKLDTDGFLQLGIGDVVGKCGDVVYRSDAGLFTDEAYTGENTIAGVIKTVTEGDIPNIYFLTGHGEKTIKDDYTIFESQAKRLNYDLDELNLNSVDAVPDDARIVYICAPQKDITLDEKEKLLDYASRGGNISLFFAPNEAEFRYTNLEAFLGEYNIVPHYDRIYETSSDMCRDGVPTTIAMSVPELESDQSFDLVSEIADAANNGIAPYITNTRSLGMVQGKNSAVLETYPLLQTASSMSGMYTSCNEKFGGTDKDIDEGAGLFNLAYYSFNKSNSSKLAVFGSADFFDDTNYVEGYTIIPIFLSLSCISWMYDSEYDMQIADKNNAYDMMHFEDEGEANKVLATFIIAPLIIALFGVAVWFRRRSA